MKAIAYSLFGYNKEVPATCFEFETYLRGFFVNCRINKVLYPEWMTVLNIDRLSYLSPFKPIFDWLVQNMKVTIDIQDDAPLCKAMLWRLKTVFKYEHPTWTYSHILCRDADSISTYREAQAVSQWIQEDRAAHCITDSISHNIPMMGGMCGFRPGYVNDRIGLTEDLDHAWEQLLKKGTGNFEKKGSDQDFLMSVIYPKVADSITEHFVLGMRETIPEGGGRHYSIPDTEIGIDVLQKQLNDCAGHIGASGYYEPPMIKWLNTIDPYRESYKQIQKQFPRIMFWQP